MMPLTILTQYWPSLLILFTALLAGLMVFFQATVENTSRNKKFLLGIALIAFLASIGSGIGSFVSSYDNDRQMKQVQDSINATKSLSQLNRDLVVNIDSLQKINNEISEKTKLLAQNTDSMTREVKSLTMKNVELTSKLNPLITKVRTLTSGVLSSVGEVHNQQTGGTSIPVIRTRIVDNLNLEPLKGGYIGDEYEYKISALPYVKNYGTYPLRNIKVIAHNLKDVSHIEYVQLIDYLAPYDSVFIDKPIVVSALDSNDMNAELEKGIKSKITWVTYRIQANVNYMYLLNVNCQRKAAKNETYYYTVGQATCVFESTNEFISNYTKCSGRRLKPPKK